MTSVAMYTSIYCLTRSAEVTLNQLNITYWQLIGQLIGHLTTFNALYEAIPIQVITSQSRMQQTLHYLGSLVACEIGTRQKVLLILHTST